MVNTTVDKVKKGILHALLVIICLVETLALAGLFLLIVCNKEINPHTTRNVMFLSRPVTLSEDITISCYSCKDDSVDCSGPLIIPAGTTLKMRFINMDDEIGIDIYTSENGREYWIYDRIALDKIAEQKEITGSMSQFMYFQSNMFSSYRKTVILTSILSMIVSAAIVIALNLYLYGRSKDKKLAYIVFGIAFGILIVIGALFCASFFITR